MSLIDASYFHSRLFLPQVNDVISRDDVRNFITRYEDEFLQKALGYELYQAFKSGIEAPTPDQKWVDIKEGKEFTWYGYMFKWTGFVNDAKLSPIANYVYFKYMEDKASDITLVGAVVPNTDNGYRESGRFKMVDAWNEMVKLNENLLRFLYANTDIYTEWKFNYSKNLVTKINSFDI